VEGGGGDGAGGEGGVGGGDGGLHETTGLVCQNVC
jgi:hypothetical protein